MYADVVFPLRLPPLTYKVPEHIAFDLKGWAVRAPLMGRVYDGLVIDTMKEIGVGGHKNLKEIQTVYHPLASEKTISFLKWLADYYLMPVGLALKASFFEEIVSVFSAADWKESIKNPEVKNQCKKNHISLPSSPSDISSDISLIHKNIKEKAYKTFLFHAASNHHEHSFLLETLKGISPALQGVIILVPEIGQMERLLPSLKGAFGERLSILHSRVSRKKRTEEVKRIITGRSDVVLGTRSAILAPLKNISFIALLDEQSQSYKGEEGLRYNARDVAVMRGYMENSTVLLSSICPSLESFYNSKVGKYEYLNAESGVQKMDFQCRTESGGGLKKPVIKIVDMTKERPRGSVIAKEVLNKSKAAVSKGEGVLFLINRKGYSLLICEDCRSIPKCARCGMSLIFFKGSNIVRCGCCGYEGVSPKGCGECKGFNIKPLGAGTERAKEELEGLLKKEALLIEKGRKKRGCEPYINPLGIDSEAIPIVIGTGYALRECRDGLFRNASLLSMDLLLSQPDFRACERAFQEVIQVSHVVSSGGQIFIQTWNPENSLWRFVRNYDFKGFYESELNQRSALNYPPFSKMALVSILTRKVSHESLNDIQEKTGACDYAGVDILGPVERHSNSRSYSSCLQLLLKSKDKRMLREAAQDLLKGLERLKGVKITVDVDPLRI